MTTTSSSPDQARITIIIGGDTRQQLERLARATDSTVSQLSRHAIRLLLEKAGEIPRDGVACLPYSVVPPDGSKQKRRASRMGNRQAPRV